MRAEKECIGCKRTLPLDEFYKRKDTGGYTGECRSCKSSRARKHFVENVERHRMLVKRRYDTFGRFARYGLTVEQYDAVLQKQDGVCALCGAAKPGGKGKWHIDHKGRQNPRKFKQCVAALVRGILCHRCNIALGHYEQLVSRVGVEKINSYLGVPSTMSSG